MKDNINIEDLFRKELGNYKVKVNPNIWKGVQAGIGTTTATVTGLSVVSKIIIGTLVAGGITFGGIFLFKTLPSSTKTTTVLLPSEEKTDNDIPKKSSIATDKETVEVTMNNATNNSKKIANINESKAILNQHKKESDLQEDTISFINKNIEMDGVSELLKNTNHKNSLITLVAPDSSFKVKANKETSSIIEPIDIHVNIERQENQFVRFKVSGVPKDAYITWDFGDGYFGYVASPEHFYEKKGNYNVILSVKINQKVITKTLNIEVKVKGIISRLPNIFTPNGDGNNDIFYVETKNLKTFQITIMNLDQKVVYRSNNISFKWDGLSLKGEPVKSGNYLYTITAEDTAGNIINEYHRLRIER